MKITRREFVKELGLISGALLAGFRPIKARALDETILDEKIPKRIFGRTGIEVSILALGMGPIGINTNLSQSEAESLINLCIDLGINYIDVAPNYGNGEEKLGNVMKLRRDEVFLVSKVEESSKDGALKQVEESLKKLQTDHLDAVHLHNFGGFNTEMVLGKDGALAGLMDARESGLIKFIGISGHEHPMRFLKALETDQIDLVMPVLNFVDRHTYDFESKVLPEAIKRKAGVAAMKVLGGAIGMQYNQPTPALMPEEYHEKAIRYSLGLKGVSTAVIGLKNKEEILQAVDAVKRYKPLSEEEMKNLEQIGKDLSGQWGAHFGPVA